MRIALDFDGVVHDYHNPKPDRRMAPPVDGALDGVKRMLRMGHDVFLHTSMAQNKAGKRAVENWLRIYHFPKLEVVAKPNADLYIDDRAYEFENWHDTTYYLGV